jgi:hypothetical protein
MIPSSPYLRCYHATMLLLPCYMLPYVAIVYLEPFYHASSPPRTLRCASAWKLLPAHTLLACSRAPISSIHMLHARSCTIGRIGRARVLPACPYQVVVPYNTPPLNGHENSPSGGLFSH